MSHLFVAAFFSGVAALLLTPLMIKFARSIRLIDLPDPTRKLHGQGMPLGGGLAVFAASAVGFVGAGLLAPELLQDFKSWPFVVGCLVICGIGVIDDYFGLRGRYKFAGQVVAVGVPIAFGLVIRKFHLLGWEFELGVLAIPFTAFWLLGAINAINLLDGADGFASTIGIIICVTIGLMASLTGHVVEAALACALAGALLGFLVFNFPPARIFLGDAGSMLIGLAVGVLAIRSSLKGPTTLALVAPLAVLAIPIFDSVVAIIRRSMTGRPLVSGDRAHLHHCLANRGFSPRGMLACVALLCIGTATAAVASVYLNNDLWAFTSVGVLGILVCSRVFGFNEFLLIAKRFRSEMVMLLNKKKLAGPYRHEIVRLQGSREWETLWFSLLEFAELHELAKVRLGLSLPWLHEDFHATWESAFRVDRHQRWRTNIPVIAEGRLLGHLEIAGCLKSESSIYEDFILLSELLEGLEPVILKLASSPAPQRPREKFVSATAVKTAG